MTDNDYRDVARILIVDTVNDYLIDDAYWYYGDDELADYDLRRLQNTIVELVSGL